MRVQVVRADGSFDDIEAPLIGLYETTDSVYLDMSAIPRLAEGDTLALLPTEDEAVLLGWLTQTITAPTEETT